jgi:Zn-dependent protease
VGLGWRPFHIPIRLTRSWFVAVGAALLLFAAGVYPYVLVGKPSLVTVCLFSVATAALFFGGLLLHEYGHALTARRLGVSVYDITLRAIGGVTHMPRRRDARHELLIAGAGPAVGLLLSVALLLAALAAQGQVRLQVLLAWSGVMQLAATMVNLLPVASLDGGRVLRAAAIVARPRQRLARALVWGAWLLTLALLLVAMTLTRAV